MTKKVAIIGAGPAGTIAGNYLIKEGIEVKIYEKNESIKSTPCGEGISFFTEEKLKKDIGFDSRTFTSKITSGIKFYYTPKYYATVNNGGHVLEREKWINGLRKHYD